MSKKKIIFVSLFIFLIAGCSNNSTHKQEVDNLESSKNSNGYISKLEVEDNFQAQLLFIDDESLFDRWNISSVILEIETISKAKKNEKFFAIILFSNTGVDKNQNANIVYNMTITTPSGETYFDQKNLGCWIDKLAMLDDKMQLCELNVAITIEDEDELGEYVVQATVFDKFKGQNVELSKVFIVE